MTKLLKSVLLFSATLVAQSAHAGDSARFEFLGFSNDGKALAYEEYGTQDGSGFPYANIYFIATEKNQFAAPAVKVIDEGAGDTATMSNAQTKRKAEVLAESTLKKLGISRNNPGVTEEPDALQTNTSKSATRFIYNLAKGVPNATYKTVVNEIKMDAGEVCKDIGYDTVALDLTLTTTTEKGSSTISLQKDAAIPASRGCPSSYNIKDIFFSEQGHIVVVLTVTSLGFEGPNVRNMVVTGKLK